MDRRLARLALNIAEGVSREDPDAEALMTDGLGTVEASAQASTYLASFLLQVLATQRGETVAQTCSYVRSLLDRE